MRETAKLLPKIALEFPEQRERREQSTGCGGMTMYPLTRSSNPGVMENVMRPSRHVAGVSLAVAEVVIISFLTFLGAIPAGSAIITFLKVDMGIFLFGMPAVAPLATIFVLWILGRATGNRSRIRILGLAVASVLALVGTLGATCLCLLLDLVDTLFFLLVPVLGAGLAVTVFHAFFARIKLKEDPEK